MKKTVILITLLLIVLAMFGQKDDEVQTLFGPGNHLGGYGGPDLKVTSFNNDLGLMVGGSGAFLINHRFSMGIGGYGLATRNTLDKTSDTSSLNLGIGYGGLKFEYTILYREVVHFSIPVLIGAGGIGVYEELDNYDSNEYNFIEGSAFFVLEPGLNVEVNIVKFMRLYAGASYRLVEGSNLGYDISNKDLSDISFNFGLRFGVF